jgi:hypothetical protein
MDATQILNRAWRAYQSTDGADAEQPFEAHSGLRRLNDLQYVILANDRRTLAVYRIRKSNGKLRRLCRWPLALGREAIPARLPVCESNPQPKNSVARASAAPLLGPASRLSPSDSPARLVSPTPV